MENQSRLSSLPNEPQEVIDSLPPQKPRPNFVVWIAAGVITLAIGIGVGLAVGKYFQPASSTTLVSIVPSTPILSPTVVPVEEADLTANWKTYTNEFWGISFKYPDFDDTCCGISGAVTGNPVKLITLADSSTVVPNTDAPFDGIALYGIPNNGNLSLDQYVEKEKATLLSDFKSMADPGQINQGVTTKTSVNGFPATVLSNYSWDGITRTYVKSNNNSFIFEISKKEKSPNHFASYDQILSTFRFAN